MKIKYLSKCFLIVIVICVDFKNVTANKNHNNEMNVGFSPNLLASILKYLSLEVEEEEEKLELKLKKDGNLDFTLGCEIDVKRDLGFPQPLYIKPNTTKIFHPTDRRGILKLAKNQKIELFCTNGFASPKGISSSSNDNDNRTTTVTLDCAHENRFTLNGRLFNFNEFSCRKYPYFSIRQRSENEKCFNNSTLLDIGFEMNNNERFIVVFTICFNPILEQTYYAKYQLTPANISPQTGLNRPKFIQGDYFPGKDINSLYSRVNQREALANTLQSDEWAEELIEETGNIFLSRGHLAAKGDFVFANEQRSTFNYINVAPQWQSFNGLNWNRIEDGSRRLAANRNLTLDVYTGTHGVLKFNDIDGNAQDIYLDIDNKKVPVPRIFYKILLDTKNKRGIALIGVNNVHISMDELQRDYVVCNDISDKVNYIKWRAKDIKRGYSYACDVNDFLKAVPHLQHVKVKSLLL